MGLLLLRALPAFLVPGAGQGVAGQGRAELPVQGCGQPVPPGPHRAVFRLFVELSHAGQGTGDPGKGAEGLVAHHGPWVGLLGTCRLRQFLVCAPAVPGTLHVLLRHSLVRVPLVHLLHEPARPAGSQRQTGAPGWGPNEGRSFTGAEQSQALSGVQGRASNAGCLVPTEVCELPHADDRDPRILPRPRPFLLRVVAPVDQVELPVVQLRYLADFLQGGQLVLDEVVLQTRMRGLQLHQPLRLGPPALRLTQDALVRERQLGHVSHQLGREALLFGGHDVHLLLRIFHGGPSGVDHALVETVGR